MPEPGSTAAETVEREWTDGDYLVLARAFMPMAAHLVTAAGVGPDDRVLDVACGTGNVALTANRRGGDVTGLDITPKMLDLARAAGDVTDADVDWRLGDATDLPFEDDTFDRTLSSVGHIFAPDPDAVAAELVRVTRQGGRIAYTVWSPESAIAAVMRTFAGFVPEPDDAPAPPIAWGDPDVASTRFGGDVSAIDVRTGTIDFPALSPAHFWDTLCTYSGVVIVALEQLDPDDRPTLDAAVVEALTPYFDDETNTVPLDYRVVSTTVG